MNATKTNIDSTIQDALTSDKWITATDLYLEVIDTIPAGKAIDTVVRRSPNMVGTAEELIAQGRKTYLQVAISRLVYFGKIERRGRGEQSSYRLAL